MTTENSADKIAQLAVAATGAPSIIGTTDDGNREFILHPPMWVAKEIPQLPQDVKPPIPQWTRQTVSLQNEMSLTEYLNRFKNSDTVIFADITRDTITGIVDYHHAADPDAKFSVKADLGQHRAILTLPRSIEWETWMARDNRRMSQLDFVVFLEDNGADIKAFGDNALDGAGLIELCSDMEATRNAKFGSTVRAGSTTTIEYTKDSGATTRQGKLIIPRSFGVKIPVYFGDDEVEITAAFRWEVSNEGGLTLWYKLIRPENVRQNRFQEIVQRIEIETDHLTTVYGTPN